MLKSIHPLAIALALIFATPALAQQAQTGGTGDDGEAVSVEDTSVDLGWIGLLGLLGLAGALPRRGNRRGDRR